MLAEGRRRSKSGAARSRPWARRHFEDSAASSARSRTPHRWKSSIPNRSGRHVIGGPRRSPPARTPCRADPGCSAGQPGRVAVVAEDTGGLPGRRHRSRRRMPGCRASAASIGALVDRLIVHGECPRSLQQTTWSPGIPMTRFTRWSLAVGCGKTHERERPVERLDQNRARRFLVRAGSQPPRIRGTRRCHRARTRRTGV